MKLLTFILAIALSLGYFNPATSPEKLENTIEVIHVNNSSETQKEQKIFPQKINFVKLQSISICKTYTSTVTLSNPQLYIKNRSFLI